MQTLDLPPGAVPSAPDPVQPPVEPESIPSYRNKKMVTMRLDPDVLDWLKSYGKGYQTRLNDLLRRAIPEDQEISR